MLTDEQVGLAAAETMVSAAAIRAAALTLCASRDAYTPADVIATPIRLLGDPLFPGGGEHLIHGEPLDLDDLEVGPAVLHDDGGKALEHWPRPPETERDVGGHEDPERDGADAEHRSHKGDVLLGDPLLDD